MGWNRKSEFNDPAVYRHRRRAAQRTTRDAAPLEKILESVVSELNQPEDPRISILRDKWASIVGPQNAKYSQPGAIQGINLLIQISHPGWLPELRKHARKILMEIQRNYPELKIRRLYFELDAG